MSSTLSIVIPARDEAEGLRRLLPELRQRYPQAEILVVDDGSGDDTAAVCRAEGASTVRQPYAMGNGAAVKAGARCAGGDILVFMDGDGQHDPADIPRLVASVEEGHAMAVGARAVDSQASFGRRFANAFYNRFASWVVGHKVEDLTSGFRAARAERFREFLHLLPNGFSYPSTVTMAFFRAGYPVSYVPIRARARQGERSSHIRPVSDGVRFLLIIFRIGTLYSPLKLFFPVSVLLFLLGCANYAYTYYTESRFTNMSALLFLTAVFVFLIGLVSEQVTQLLYSRVSGESPGSASNAAERQPLPSPVSHAHAEPTPAGQGRHVDQVCTEPTYPAGAP
jgi:glycosyltransferase involved in cell wall biosynthesis